MLRRAGVLCLQGDESFLEGLQDGVGEAAWPSRMARRQKTHVEPLDEGAAGEAVKERLLVEPTCVEVRRSSASRRKTQGCLMGRRRERRCGEWRSRRTPAGGRGLAPVGRWRQ